MSTNLSIMLLKTVVLLALIVGISAITGSCSAQNKNRTGDEKKSLMLYLFSSVRKMWEFIGDASDFKSLTELSAEELMQFLLTVAIAFIGYCCIKKIISDYLKNQIVGI